MMKHEDTSGPTVHSEVQFVEGRPSNKPASAVQQDATERNASTSPNHDVGHPLLCDSNQRHVQGIDVELEIGELVRQGGFHAWFELKSVKLTDGNDNEGDTSSEKWLLKPASLEKSSPSKRPNKVPQKKSHHKRNSSSSFGSNSSGLGSLIGGGGHHRRNSSTKSSGSVQSAEALPPVVRTCTIQLVAPFETDIDTAEIQKPEHKSRRSLLSGHSKKNSSGSNKSSLGGMDFSKILADAEDTTKPQYVIKCLSTATQQDEFLLQQGLRDMKLEAEMMRRLSHPRLRASGTMTIDGDGSPENHPKEYPLLILDRLSTTLDIKLETWYGKQQKLAVIGTLATSRGRMKSWQYFQNRLSCVVDICSALKYLHSEKIIYRNLKPENIGFDRHDKVQLMNFGLSKDLNTVKQTSKGLYRLTGLTGNARYMAPEVALKQPYNEKCDVYSFALIMWQIMTLKTPFAKYNVKKMYQHVFTAPHARPSLEQDFVSTYVQWIPALLENMWSPDVHERHTMEEILTLLQKQQEELIQEYSSGSTPQ